MGDIPPLAKKFYDLLGKRIDNIEADPKSRDSMYIHYGDGTTAHLTMKVLDDGKNKVFH